MLCQGSSQGREQAHLWAWGLATPGEASEELPSAGLALCGAPGGDLVSFLMADRRAGARVQRGTGATIMGLGLASQALQLLN